jgi:hypothetical protein
MVQDWVPPACKALATLSLAPVMLQQPEQALGGSSSVCNGPHAAAVVLSYNHANSAAADRLLAGELLQG